MGMSIEMSMQVILKDKYMVPEIKDMLNNKYGIKIDSEFDKENEVELFCVLNGVVPYDYIDELKKDLRKYKGIKVDASVWYTDRDPDEIFEIEDEEEGE